MREEEEIIGGWGREELNLSDACMDAEVSSSRKRSRFTSEMVRRSQSCRKREMSSDLIPV